MASAMVGMMQIIGNITGYALVSIAAYYENRPLAIAAVVIVELVTMASVVLKVDKGPPPKPREGKSWFAIARETWGTDILGAVHVAQSPALFFLMPGILAYGMPQEHLRVRQSAPAPSAPRCSAWSPQEPPSWCRPHGSPAGSDGR
jgi:hypothetical protein